MSALLTSWTMEVDRGPDWLFVRLHPTAATMEEGAELAASMWALLEQHFTYRLVLELDQLPILPSYLIGQLVLLHKRIHAHGGLLRLCGLSKENLEGCFTGAGWTGPFAFIQIEKRPSWEISRPGRVESFQLSVIRHQN